MTDATNWPEILVAVGTVFGALATTAAVIVALWQSKKAADAAKRAEELSQRQFDEATQLPALHSYVRAWREVATPAAGSAASPYERLTNAELASTTWRDVNRKKLDNILDIERLHREIVKCIRDMEPAYLEISEDHWNDSGIKRATRVLTNLASGWQTGSAEDRVKYGADSVAASDRLRNQYEKFVDSVKARIKEQRQQATNRNR